MNDIKDRKIENILLMQPNFTILGKRSWKMPPYNLAILKACLKDYDVWLYDPNFSQEDESQIRQRLRKSKADFVGMTTFSTEYIEEVSFHAKMIREELPNAVIVLGGVIPTVWIEKIIEDPNIDYFIMGEGEYRTASLLNGNFDDGIAFRRNGVSTINPPKEFIYDLDSIPIPDWNGLDMSQYFNYKMKYSPQIYPRQLPYATTITSRGCPYKCTFCAAKTVSGTKVRMRSAENVLKEIDWYVNEHGIKEMIFLDDHFLHKRSRAIEIMQGLVERNYGLSWKCANVAVFSLNDEILELMKKSGSYQLTLSIESGDQDVLKNLIKKPVNLDKAREMIKKAKQFDFEIICNFIIGTPGETWEQIRRSLDYAASIDVDSINIHIATPLPKTELMDMCLERGLIKSDTDLSGYTSGRINTDEFTAFELQVLRAFEWDRINFSSPEKIQKMAQMNGLTIEETQQWRVSTRQSLGKTEHWNKRFDD